jgi:hypothetical protein
MLTNEQMIPGRFLRMARVRRLRRAIEAAFAADGIVQVTTYTRSTVYRAKHAEMFRFGRYSAYVARGKNWDCIDGCSIRCLAGSK